MRIKIIRGFKTYDIERAENINLMIEAHEPMNPCLLPSVYRSRFILFRFVHFYFVHHFSSFYLLLS